MLNKTYSIAIVIAGICLIAAPIHADSIQIDGDLSDWGVVVADNNGSSFNFSSDIGLVSFMLEDQDDSAGEGAFLGPNYGGQNFDAELMAVAYGDSIMSIAILTGQRPDNGFGSFNPGDIRIETSGGVYGIEVGGGQGGQAGGLITEGTTGSTYELNRYGNTIGYQDAAPAQTVGSIWSGASWINDPIAPYGPVQMEIDGDSLLVGMSNYAYTRNDVTDQHAVIELSFNVSAFDGERIESIAWHPSCGNDELVANVSIVPEPATIGLLALSAVCMVRRVA